MAGFLETVKGLQREVTELQAAVEVQNLGWTKALERIQDLEEVVDQLVDHLEVKAKPSKPTPKK